MNVINLVWRMARVRTVLMMTMFSLIGCAATMHTGSLPVSFLLAPILLTCIFVHATCVNDVADEAVDRINLAGVRHRPLVSHDVSRASLLWLGLGALLAAYAVALTISPWLLLITVGVAAFSWVYSNKPVALSHRGLLASLLLPASYVLYPIAIGVYVAGGSMTTTGWCVAAILYVAFIGRILLKDFRDEVGDRLNGKRTPLVRYGAPRVCMMSAAAFAVSTVLIGATFITSWPLVVVIAASSLAGILYLLRQLAQETRLMKQLMTVGVIGHLANIVAMSIVTLLLVEHRSVSMIAANGALIAVVAIAVQPLRAVLPDLLSDVPARIDMNVLTPSIHAAVTTVDGGPKVEQHATPVA